MIVNHKLTQTRVEVMKGKGLECLEEDLKDNFRLQLQVNSESEPIEKVGSVAR